jgi:hypothetical protein
LSAGQAFADGLRAESRLTALLGADEIMLDDDVPTLLSLLAQSAVEHQDEIDAARVEAVTDDRVLAALGDGGLLPPGEDLTAACVSWPTREFSPGPGGDTSPESQSMSVTRFSLAARS